MFNPKAHYWIFFSKCFHKISFLINILKLSENCPVVLHLLSNEVFFFTAVTVDDVTWMDRRPTVVKCKWSDGDEAESTDDVNITYSSNTLIVNVQWNRSKWNSGYGKEE
jgi:hypothetical protein